jgi:hypothetical protein
LGFPAYELSCHQKLTDGCKFNECEGLWKQLGWKWSGNRFSFDNSTKSKKVLLDFDLDYFVIRYRNYRIPWVDEVFENEFLNEPYNNGTGKEFVQGLIKQAGIITMAKEPVHCGSVDKSNKILDKLNYFVFDNKIQLDLNIL